MGKLSRHSHTDNLHPALMKEAPNLFEDLKNSTRFTLSYNNQRFEPFGSLKEPLSPLGHIKGGKGNYHRYRKVAKRR